jgi:hypothetical protein
VTADQRRPTAAVSDAAASARNAAREVAARCPRRIGRRVDLRGLAADLNIDVLDREMPDAGRWSGPAPPSQTQLFGEEAREAIYLRKEVEGDRRRFAFAHELGHAILNRSRGAGAAAAVRYQEDYAQAFASELLMAGVGEGVKAEFRAATLPTQALALAGSIGAPMRVVMRRARREKWLKETGLIWLDILTRPNEHTGFDRRPRVDQVVLDSSRWFLPKNRSVRGVLGDDQWLVSGFMQSSCRGQIAISRLDGEPPRFSSTSVSVEVDAIRLRPPGVGVGMEILAIARMGI